MLAPSSLTSTLVVPEIAVSELLSTLPLVRLTFALFSSFIPTSRPSSVLFSKKLERIKRNPKVALSISDPAAVPNARFHRATIQGDARVDDTDIHHGWERVLPLWRAKEPAIDAFFAQRVALPLFWERAVIEIEPRRAFLWPAGDTKRAPQVFEVSA